jgi:hypothetical protein
MMAPGEMSRLTAFPRNAQVSRQSSITFAFARHYYVNQYAHTYVVAHRLQSLLHSRGSWSAGLICRRHLPSILRGWRGRHGLHGKLGRAQSEFQRDAAGDLVAMRTVTAESDSLTSQRNDLVRTPPKRTGGRGAQSPVIMSPERVARRRRAAVAPNSRRSHRLF